MADHKPLYRWSLQDAVTHNEVQDWRDSYRENCDCARAIERAIADQYHDNILENGTKDIIDRYGFDRVNWVLANTLQEKAHDGRFSQDNKRWAKGFFIPSDDVRWHFCVESHPGLTDLFINQTREAWQKLGLFDASHCSEDNDYAGKLLILKPSVLKDEFKASDYQLFYAESGFGCSPTASGRKVFGKFLKDGENTSFNRSDFLGVIKDECIPEWAAEKLAELEYFGGKHGATHKIAYQEIAILTPVRVLATSKMTLPGRTWEHLNVWDCPYKMKFDAAEVSQIIIRYDGMYRRCIRAKFTDLCYEGTKGEWRPVGSVLFGNASVIEFNSDAGSFENLLYVQEDVSDTKEQLETKLDNPDEIILDRICDEVFGDG